MKALRLTGIGAIGVEDVPDPVPGPGEAVVALRAAALNHRDVWIYLGQYAGLKYPVTPGSDGAGVVSSVGPGAEPSWVGREVIINPSFGWGPDERAQSGGFSILGLPKDGTIAEKVCVPVSQLAARPRHLSWEASAALPLGGLTAFRALITRAQLEPSERILITGIGGGVALAALQVALAQKAEVWVTSSAQDKIDKAVRLGAKGGFLYTQTGWAAAAAASPGLFPVILDSAGGPGFGDLVDLAAPGGRIVFFGATRGNPPELPMRKVFWRQLNLLGTTMGSSGDWELMVDFVIRHRIEPVVESVFSLEQGPQAFALMERGGQFGKIVIRMG